MDISYWTKLAPDVVYEPTRKRYYGKYLCKLVLRIECGRLINTSELVDIEYELQNRISLLKSYNFGGSWRVGRIDALKYANREDLTCLRSIRYAFKDRLKFRIEEPLVQIYSETEDQLKEVAQNFTSSMLVSIKSIGFPESQKHSEILNQDKILVNSSNIPYSHKVMLRDGDYGVDTKRQLLEYLNNLGTEVRVSKGTKNSLESTHGFLWGGYFYTNDTSLVTFISLINPKLVGKIHELVGSR